MSGWICPVTGTPVDGGAAALVAWHAAIHLGVTIAVLAGGLVFLALAVRAYRSTGPVRPAEAGLRARPAGSVIGPVQGAGDLPPVRREVRAPRSAGSAAGR